MSNREKKAEWLFFWMALWVIFFQLIGGRWLGTFSVPAVLVISQLVYLIPVLLFVVFAKVPVKQWIPHERIRFSVVLMTVLFVLLLQPLMVCLNIITMLFSKNYVMETQAGLRGLSFGTQLILMALMPALSEEFMFRGIFYGAFRKKGIFCGAIFSGLVFGMLHLNFNQFGYALMLGAAFALLLEATGSIFYCMVGHFVINGMSVVLSFVTGMADEFPAEEASQLMTRDGMFDAISIYLIPAFVSTALAFCVYYWIAEKCGRIGVSSKRGGETAGKKARLDVLPLILGAVLCVGFMIFRDLIAVL
jgi:membrane protease YdiL (CAAX protease family)